MLTGYEYQTYECGVGVSSGVFDLNIKHRCAMIVLFALRIHTVSDNK